MSKVLTDLLEKRDAAQNAFDAFVAPLFEAGEAFTEEQIAKKAELRSVVEALDERIDEVAAEEKRQAALAEARAVKPAEAETAKFDVTEPSTYGPLSGNSMVCDMARASHAGFRGHKEAQKRLQAAHHEVAVEYQRTNSEEKRAQIERLVLQESRDGSANGAQVAADAIKEFRSLGKVGRSEYRAMDTTGTSGGSFATPVYFVNQYAPWVEYGRAFINETNLNPLPDYGMTVYLPQITGGAGISPQSTQNTPINETDPTAGYLSSGLTTEAGQVTISQQILDRAGPNFQFDVMVFDQLRRDYNAKIDLFVMNQVLATSGIGSVNYTGTFALTAANGASSFRTKVAQAKANTASTVGTVTTATHLYVTDPRWEFIDAYTDSTGRPVTVSPQAGPFNAVVAGGDNSPIAEGNTGFKMAGLNVFADSGIPTAGTTTQDQAIVARMKEIYVWEGAPVTRTLPQTLGNQLSVLLQLFNYAAVIVRYPKAVNVISGTAMAPPAW